MSAQGTIEEGHATEMVVRAATAADAESCGRIFYEAFESIASRHNFPIEPGSPEFCHYFVGEQLAHDNVVGLVAERHGEVVGSTFIDERGEIAGIGPVTVDPAAQDGGIGRAVMQAA